MPTSDLLIEKLRAYRQMESLGMLGSGSGVHRIELRNASTIYVAATDNRMIASRDRPIGITVPLGRPLSDIVKPTALMIRPDQPNARQNRRYVWAIIHGIDPPLDVTTRVRGFCNCQELTARTGPDDPSYTTSVSFFGGEHGSHGSPSGHSPGGASVCLDLTPALAHLDPPRLRADRLTVQLAPTARSVSHGQLF